MSRFILGIASAFAIVAVLVIAFAAQQGANAGAGSAANMAVDMDPAGNTATSIGPADECARINNNDTLDADEDVTADTLAFDVTVTDIPAEYPMIGFGLTLAYNEDVLTIMSVDTSQLLAANAGSIVFESSEPTPDTDGNGQFIVSGFDSSDAIAVPPEFGSGVLAGLNIAADAGAPAGQYIVEFASELGVPFASTLDPTNAAWTADSVTDAFLAIDEPCGKAPPTPSPTPTPAPFAKGDLQCDNDVDSVDALMALRFIAGLGVNQQPGCPEIGSTVARQVAGAGSDIFGDMNCNSIVEAVDPLFILRHVASLGISLPPNCAPIGQ